MKNDTRPFAVAIVGFVVGLGLSGPLGGKAAAGVLYNQPADFPASNNLSAWTSTFDPVTYGSIYTTYDNFSLTSAAAIGSLTWQGFSFNVNTLDPTTTPGRALMSIFTRTLPRARPVRCYFPRISASPSLPPERLTSSITARSRRSTITRQPSRLASPLLRIRPIGYPSRRSPTTRRSGHGHPAREETACHIRRKTLNTAIIRA